MAKNFSKNIQSLIAAALFVGALSLAMSPMIASAKGGAAGAAGATATQAVQTGSPTQPSSPDSNQSGGGNKSTPAAPNRLAHTLTPRQTRACMKNCAAAGMRWDFCSQSCL